MLLNTGDGFLLTFKDLLHDVLLESLECHAHIHSLDDNLCEDGYQLQQCYVVLVLEPAANENTILRLNLKVFCHVVNNDS